MNLNIAHIKKLIQPILDSYGVVRSAVFGSVARGEANEGSDIDILVELKAGSSLLDLVQLQFDLDKVLGRKVDVLTFNSLHPLLKARVQQEAVRL